MFYFENEYIARDFFNYYTNNGNFDIHLQEFISNKDYERFTDEIDKIGYCCKLIFEKELNTSKLDDYKDDLSDFLNHLLEKSMPKKYERKILKLLDDLENCRSLKPSIESLRKSNLNPSSDDEFYKSVTYNYTFNVDDELKKFDLNKVEADTDIYFLNKDIVIELKRNLLSVKKYFLRLSAACHGDFPEEVINNEILAFHPKIDNALDNLQDLVFKINTYSYPNQLYLKNTIDFSTSLVDEFLNELKINYRLDIQKTLYGKKINQFLNSIKLTLDTLIKEPNEYETLPTKLKRINIITNKDKVYINVLLNSKFGKTKTGVSKIWKYLKEYRTEFNLTHRQFCDIVEEVYNTNTFKDNLGKSLKKNDVNSIETIIINNIPEDIR